MTTKRINLISGPRNISTALMYSFSNRPDTQVIDEPMYAYYLDKTGINHPGRDEILDALPRDITKVKSKLLFQNIESDHYFIKGMAHHYLDLDLEFISKMKNVFLIRDPYKLLLSFSKVIIQPTMQDIGLKKEFEIFDFCKDSNIKAIVLDSNEVLQNPRIVLSKLCDELEIPFMNNMLEWEAGPIAEDGVWAKYWYDSVHQSTGFTNKLNKDEEMPDHLIPLYEESLPYYKYLLEESIRA